MEIKAVQHCIQILETKNVVVLFGRKGCGKSRNGLEILRRLKQSHTNIEVFKLTGLHYVSDTLKCGVVSIVLFDNAFDKTCKQLSSDNQILDHLYSYTSQNKVKAIFVMRNTVRHKCQMLLSTHRVFNDSIDIDLNSQPFQLTWHEKLYMFIKLCHRNKIRIAKKDDNLVYDAASAVLEIENVFDIINNDTYLGFPDCCRLFTDIRKRRELGAIFFTYPSHDLINEIDTLRIKGGRNDMRGLQYVLLVYMITNSKFDGFKNDRYFQNKSKGVCELVINNIETQTIREIFGVCYARNLHVHSPDIKHAYKELECQYLFNKDGTLFFQHKCIQDGVLISYSKINPAAIIPLLSIDHINDLVCLQNYKEQEGEIVILIFKEYYKEMAKHFVFLLHKCYDNTYMNPTYLNRLLSSRIIKEIDTDFACQLLQCIQDQNETAQQMNYITHDFPLYILRTLDDKNLTINHVVFGDNNSTCPKEQYRSLGLSSDHTMYDVEALTNLQIDNNAQFEQSLESDNTEDDNNCNNYYSVGDEFHFDDNRDKIYTDENNFKDEYYRDESSNDEDYLEDECYRDEIYMDEDYLEDECCRDESNMDGDYFEDENYNEYDDNECSVGNGCYENEGYDENVSDDDDDFMLKIHLMMMNIMSMIWFMLMKLLSMIQVVNMKFVLMMMNNL